MVGACTSGLSLMSYASSSLSLLDEVFVRAMTISGKRKMSGDVGDAKPGS